MPNYIKYNISTGEIMQNLSCPESMLADQPLEDNEEIVGVKEQVDDSTYIYNGKELVQKSDHERYKHNLNTIPHLNSNMDDSQIDQVIEDHLHGIADINEYKVRNYRELRKAVYPPIEDFIDAYVKDDAKQLENYKNKCKKVKNKFPKQVAKTSQ